MVACCFCTCHVSIYTIAGMNRSTPFVGILPHPYRHPPKLHRQHYLSGQHRPLLEFGFGFGVQKSHYFAVSAQIRKPFSTKVNFDSQDIQSHDLSQLQWLGPVPGEIAEIEAYCRIFRSAEQLHAALMSTLCNPLTGECSVLYDVPSEEKTLLEDKIVSVLGCIISLLNTGREDVLSGRSSVKNSFRVADRSLIEDKLPPLAIFRGEMKRCCESLHVALENYLTPDDDQSLYIWRKLQRLKNVCYDFGLPRGDDDPCHTVFANWSTVYLSTSKEDMVHNNSEVAFWKGSQVTEEGLRWLISKGFKTIVDLRAETVKDNFYQAAITESSLSGNIELVNFPVEVGTAPSMEQVQKFASMVSDISKRPIYLHSKEGVWRTSAMITRWRHYMSRFTSNYGPGHLVSPSDTLLKNTNGIVVSKESSRTEQRLEESVSSEDSCSNVNNRDLSTDGACGGQLPQQGMKSVPVIADEMGLQGGFCSAIDPLKAQLPPCNIFSRKEMSKFFKSKKIAPSTYFNNQVKKLAITPVSRETNIGMRRNGAITYASVSVNEKAGSSNGSLNSKHTHTDPQGLPAGSRTYRRNNDYDLDAATVNGTHIREEGINVSNGKYDSLEKNVKAATVRRDQKSKDKADDEVGSIEGNMCASTTGVVRVQSRKKAEMFLVRTDGFSCTREKVTESSLAFTHPSTQQQMLMWKSTPKTVLLLKKLGEELIEEAKEVASFLYHQEKMNVLVEPDVHDIFSRIPGFGFVQTFYSQDTGGLHESVDFVACLGGDGVILHASNIFKDAVPPVVSFNLGSLGFLTSHSFEDYKKDLRQVIHGNNTADGVYITLRMRLRCEIFRNGKPVPGKIFDVLNEVVVDRGSNPYLSKIECYEHNRLITKVQGDGVIIATPTGSTAYSTAAGGSMVHPNVPCMLFTPICPHSLSFRPVILPDSAKLELKIPEDARSNAWVSFDGKRRQQLSRGDSVRISMSQRPLPTVNKYDQTGDWFHSLIRCLNWNERQDQKAF